MAESNAEWGDLAEHTSDMADAWDRAVSLPDPGVNPMLDALCESKHITIPALLRVGARLADDSVIVYGYGTGLKYRDLMTGRRWNFLGSTFPLLKIVPSAKGDRTRVIVSESETDAAWLSDRYDADIAILPAGAKAVHPAYIEQLSKYPFVYLGLDNDDAGNVGTAKLQEGLPNALDFRPPDVNDWCSLTSEPPELPVIRENVPTGQIVSASEMMELPEPTTVSWYDSALLPVGGLALIHGAFKSFKTFLALDGLAQLAQGNDWLEFAATEEPCKVLVVQYELPWAFYRQRVLRMQNAATDKEAFNANFNTWTPMLRPKLRASDRKSCDAFIREVVEAEVQVVLMDPIRRAAGAVDFNDEKEVRSVLNLFERLNSEGVTVIATHHDNKEAMRHGSGDPLGMTGSGAFGGDPDSIMSIGLPPGEDPQESLKRNVHFTLRNAPPIGARAFQMTEDGMSYQTTPWESDEDPTAPTI